MSEPFDTPRAAPRVDVRLPARLHLGESVVEVETVNMSVDGLLLSGDALADGTDCAVEIDLDELGWQRLTAQVVRTDPSGEHLAARFADAASSGNRAAIKEFLQRYLG